jgi:hypothetical protein
MNCGNLKSIDEFGRLFPELPEEVFDVFNFPTKQKLLIASINPKFEISTRLIELVQSETIMSKYAMKLLMKNISIVKNINWNQFTPKQNSKNFFNSKFNSSTVDEMMANILKQVK